MAIFQFSRGIEENLPTIYREGYAYFTTDTGKLFIDISNQKRVQLNAFGAEYLINDDGTITMPDDIFTTDDVIPIENGGTGGTSKETARDSLNVYSKEEVDKMKTKSYTTTLTPTGWISENGVFTYSYSNTELSCGTDGIVPPLIVNLNNSNEYKLITSAEVTPKQGIIFTASQKPTLAIELIIIDNK